MKNIEEIKNEVAVKHGFDEWDIYSFNRSNGTNIDAMVNEVAIEHSKQCCDEQIKSCSNEVKYACSHCGFEHKDSENVINTPNVVTLK